MADSLDLDSLEALRPKLVNRIWRAFGDDSADLVADVLADAALRIQNGDRVTIGFVKTRIGWRTTDEIRKRQRRPGLVELTGDIDQPNDEAAYEPSAWTWTFESFGQLPVRQQLLLALTATGFRPAEIAELTGINYAIVHKDLWRARRRMRSSLPAALASRP